MARREKCYRSEAEVEYIGSEVKELGFMNRVGGGTCGLGS